MFWGTLCFIAFTRMKWINAIRPIIKQIYNYFSNLRINMLLWLSGLSFAL